MATAEDPDIDRDLKVMKTPMSEANQSETSSYHGSKTPGGGGVGMSRGDRERKLGHRRVDEKTGTVTYKKKTTSELMAAIQLGIGQSVGGLSSKPERDLLMQDFGVVQSVFFPSEGSNITPAHHYSDFKFKTYAPLAFRSFRELFNIRPDDFMLSLCDETMTELSNPGAGGSIFYMSADDEFIIKTAQHKEAGFLQKLLPGYYMNLFQNPRTLLPKFYGLFCYQCGGKNIRFVVMNNILPSVVKMHEKYDLKGSTYKRKASKNERAKSAPTLKDLDFMEIHPEGLLLEKETYDALLKTIQRDCRVLESFKIMDYSLLLAIHNLDQAKRDRVASNGESAPECAGTSTGLGTSHGSVETGDGKPRALARGKSIRTKVAQYSTPMDSIQVEVRDMFEEFDDDDIPPGGIPAKNAKGERLLLYLGVIDILQCYRFRKKFEHTFKSMITDGDTVSVTRPSFYADRFYKFFTNTVFRKAPSPKNFRRSLKHSPSKRKPGERPGGRTTSITEDHREHIPGTIGARPDLLIGSSTPPPTFAEAIETGARPRGQPSMSPNMRPGDSDTFRSERTYFQTIQQQEDTGSMTRGSGSMKVRHSPLSMSESTPTYTDFTEGTPSYTASSPSCCSDVLDTNVPNLPLERDSAGLSQESGGESSPSKTMAASSSTEASFYSAVSYVDTTVGDGQRDGSVNVLVSRSEEKYSSNTNSQTVTHSVVSHSSGDLTRCDQNQSISQSNNSTTEIRVHSPNPNSDGHINSEPRISVVSQKSGDTSFSTQSESADSQYTESIVSETSIERSVTSGQSGSTDMSWNMNESAKMVGKESNPTLNVASKVVEEPLNEVDESTHL